MSSTWADLFKSDKKFVEASNQSPGTTEHEISNDWLCVDDENNCEEVHDLEKHEFLTEDQKERRAQWQKRLQKGRSKQHSSMPSKARSRKTSQVKTENNKVQSTSNKASSNSQEVSLRAKLRLAVEAAAAGGSNEEGEEVSGNSFQPHREKAFQKNSRGQRGSRRMNTIQQPCQRGMN